MFGGNEAADRAAKEALKKEPTDDPHDLFRPKTLGCQIFSLSLAERMG